VLYIGITLLPLPGARIAHSRFKIPLVATDDTTCSIKTNSQLAKLIKRAVLIIWEETPMNFKYVFDIVDKTLKDTASYNESK
jgi:hypothetical protein